eukprot:m51a1_g7890 putative rna helicase-like splicing factor (627) ;mRNA; r:79997-88850
MAEALPIAAYRAQILAAVAGSSVAIVVGETGCGKTTQIAQYVADGWPDVQRLLAQQPGSPGAPALRCVGVTNPRRVGAVTVARRVAGERGGEVGGEVGFAVRFVDRTSPRTRIKFMTDGVLLREIVSDRDLDRYSALVLDEAHERSINTDILFGLLKEVIARRPSLRLIVTSATLDSAKFSRFFGGCPVINVPGRTFPVECHYVPPTVNVLTYSEQSINLGPTIDLVANLHMTAPEGDILVFLTGQDEIARACRDLADRIQQLALDMPDEAENAPDILVLPLHASLPPEEQLAVFEPPPPHTRKVVFSTNVAETSVTINGIVYVVDPGYVKQNWFSAELGMDTLRVVLVSKSAADQRLGRAGRTREGHCYRLYSQSLYDERMTPETLPEIRRASLRATVLSLKVLGVADVSAFGFLDAPDDVSLAEALTHLHAIGALDDAGAPTELGRQIERLPLEPALARALVAATAASARVARAAVTVCAMLSVENVFFKTARRAEGDPVDEARARLAGEAERRYGRAGDHLVMLEAHAQWRASGRDREWCRAHGVGSQAMQTVEQVRAQIGGDLVSQRLIGASECGGGDDDGSDLAPGEVSALLEALCAGFFTQTARRQLNQSSFLINNNLFH